MGKYIPSNKEEFVARKIVIAAYNVHKDIEPGLLELTINFYLPIIKKGIKRYIL